MSSKRVVLLRSNAIDPDSRVEKEANSLSVNGYGVTLLAWDRSKSYKVKKDIKELKDAKVERVSFGAKAEFGAGMRSLIPYLKFQFSFFMWLLRNKEQYDICHFCDFDTAFFGSLACKITKKKFIFDIFDYVSADSSTKIKKIIKSLEDNVINKADGVIICTEDRKRQIQGTSPKNLTIIHNSPSSLSECCDKQSSDKNDDKIKIVYVGILQDHRLLKEMVNAVSKTENIELHIGGFGKYEEFMKDAAKRFNNIKFYGKISYSQTLEIESKSDIMTAIYDPCIANHIYAAPNKFYESLMLGKPVIMVRNTGMSEIVEKENIGVLIDYTEESFIDGVNTLINQKNEWKVIEKRMKDLYSKSFSWDEMEKRLIQLYENILKK